MNASLPNPIPAQTNQTYYDPPLKITIPLPSEIPMLRGIHATTKSGGNLRVRCSNSEYAEIQQEADKLGMTISSFMRFVGRAVARALKEHRVNGSSTIGTEYSVE